jgi:hypothetical protein
MALEEIKLQGRVDCARGLGLNQNPYYRPERMPRAIGDDFDEWRQKVDAWEAGWAEATSEQALLGQPNVRLQGSMA